MTTMKHVCSNSGARDQQLIAYLYGEGSAEDRTAFERHLSVCALCRVQLDAFRGVRAELGQWTSPEPEFSVTATGGPAAAMPSLHARRVQVPLWVQAVAAVLVVGVAMGVANLEINYSPVQGLSVRTGWRHEVPPPSTTAAGDQWRTEMTALEQRLRQEMSSHALPAVAPDADEAALRRVRVLVAESELRQQRDLALRFAEMAREVESQRQADLVKIDRSLGLIQSRTGIEVMRTQQQVNSLAQRVSQRE